MKLSIIFALIATICAGPAHALSCLRPDVARAFGFAQASDDTYIVLLGQFDFDAPVAREAVTDDPIEVTLPARFNGQMLSGDGFTDAPPLDISIALTCAGPWCGTVQDTDAEMLGFVQETDAGYTMTIDPCYSRVFTAPSPTDIARVEACMRGERCDPAF